MRSFLLTSVICMLAAGIYGTIDLTFDLKNGTFIQYEDEGETVSVSQFAYSSKGILKKTNVKIAQKKETKKLKAPTLITSFTDLEFEDFSRGEPPMYLESLLELSAPDSLVNADVSTAINDTVAAVKEKVKSDSLGKEERKFSMKLYSRGRPPKKVVKEEVEAEEKDKL